MFFFHSLSDIRDPSQYLSHFEWFFFLSVETIWDNPLKVITNENCYAKICIHGRRTAKVFFPRLDLCTGFEKIDFKETLFMILRFRLKFFWEFRFSAHLSVANWKHFIKDWSMDGEKSVCVCFAFNWKCSRSNWKCLWCFTSKSSFVCAFRKRGSCWLMELNGSGNEISRESRLRSIARKFIKLKITSWLRRTLFFVEFAFINRSSYFIFSSSGSSLNFYAFSLFIDPTFTHHNNKFQFIGKETHLMCTWNRKRSKGGCKEIIFQLRWRISSGIRAISGIEIESLAVNQRQCNFFCQTWKNK